MYAYDVDLYKQQKKYILTPIPQMSNDIFDSYEYGIEMKKINTKILQQK